jgi:hypothetical protein
MNDLIILQAHLNDAKLIKSLTSGGDGGFMQLLTKEVTDLPWDFPIDSLESFDGFEKYLTDEPNPLELTKLVNGELSPNIGKLSTKN